MVQGYVPARLPLQVKKTVNDHYDPEHRVDYLLCLMHSDAVPDARRSVDDVQNALNSIFVSQVGFHGCKMPLPHSKHFGT